MCRIAPSQSSARARVWTEVRRRLSLARDIAFRSAEIAYYPLLILGITMILLSN